MRSPAHGPGPALRCGALLFLLLTAACAHADPDPEVRFTDPAAPVEAIFAAARSEDPSILPMLCRPDGGGDGDVRDVCGMTPDHERWDEFVEWFSTGRITGEAAVRQDRATVPFVFGPDGSRQEEMDLVRIDGRWYLSSF